MGNSSEFQLVFEGTVDDAPETLQRLKGVMIADLELSVPEVQAILSAAPSTVVAGTSEIELEAMKAVLQQAGARVYIVQPKAATTTSDQNESSAASDELAAVDFDTTVEETSNIHTELNSEINPAAINFDSPESEMDMGSDNLISPVADELTGIDIDFDFGLDSDDAAEEAEAEVELAPDAEIVPNPTEAPELDLDKPVFVAEDLQVVTPGDEPLTDYDDTAELLGAVEELSFSENELVAPVALGAAPVVDTEEPASSLTPEELAELKPAAPEIQGVSIEDVAKALSFDDDESEVEGQEIAAPVDQEAEPVAALPSQADSEAEIGLDFDDDLNLTEQRLTEQRLTEQRLTEQGQASSAATPEGKPSKQAVSAEDLLSRLQTEAQDELNEAHNDTEALLAEPSSSLVLDFASEEEPVTAPETAAPIDSLVIEPTAATSDLAFDLADDSEIPAGTTLESTAEDVRTLDITDNPEAAQQTVVSTDVSDIAFAEPATSVVDDTAMDLTGAIADILDDAVPEASLKSTHAESEQLTVAEPATPESQILETEEPAPVAGRLEGTSSNDLSMKELQDIMKHEARPAAGERSDHDGELEETTASSGQPSKLKNLQWDLIIPIIIGCLVLGIGNWFFFTSADDTGFSSQMVEQTIAKDVREAKAAKKQAAKAAAVKAGDKQSVAQQLTGASDINGITSELTAVLADGTLSDIKLSFKTEAPPALTPEEIVLNKKKAPWISQVVVERIVLAQAEDGKISGSGQAKVYIDYDRSRHRDLTEVTITGLLKKKTGTLKLNFSLEKNWAGKAPAAGYKVKPQKKGFAYAISSGVTAKVQKKAAENPIQK
jgi:hypothetical protein